VHEELTRRSAVSRTPDYFPICPRFQPMKPFSMRLAGLEESVIAVTPTMLLIRSGRS